MSQNSDSEIERETFCDFDEDRYDWDQSTLDLSQQNLTELPSKLVTVNSWDHVSILKVNFNYLRQLPDDFCPKFRSLKILHLDGNDLRQLPSDLGLLNQLQELYINNNKLGQLPDFICSLTQLKVLIAHNNGLNQLPSNIGSLESLEVLNVRDNSLQHLPSSFGKMSRLKNFEASNNQLSTLPDNFGSLASLVVLDLGYNYLNRLPESFGDLPSITHLVLEKNSLNELPQRFLSSMSLISLELSENSNITSVPEWMGQMANVIEISLQCCGLIGSPFPESMGHVCKKLQKFDLSGNMIEVLPESFGLMESLIDFDMGSARFEPERKDHMRNGNNIRQLPSSFGSNFHNMTDLRLDECHINFLPESFGSGLGKLKILDLHCNNLMGKLPSTFCSMVELEFLKLSMNGLTELPSDIGNMTQLKELILHNNRIKELPESFCQLVHLETLDLYDNPFDSVPGVIEFLFKNHKLKADVQLNFEIKSIEEKLESCSSDSAVGTSAEESLNSSLTLTYEVRDESPECEWEPEFDPNQPYKYYRFSRISIRDPYSVPQRLYREEKRFIPQLDSYPDPPLSKSRMRKLKSALAVTDVPVAGQFSDPEEEDNNQISNKC